MRSLRARLQDIKRLLKNAEELELSAEAILRLHWFQFCLEHRGNVSLTCRHFGIARSTFLRWAERFRATSIDTLEERSRRPHTVRQPEFDEAVIALVREIRMQQPLLGKIAISEMLKTQHKIDCSASTVGRIIARHRFFFADTQSHREKRGAVSEDTTDTTIEHQTESGQESVPYFPKIHPLSPDSGLEPSA